MSTSENSTNLLIYLTPTCVYRSVYSLNNETDEHINFQEASLIEFQRFRSLKRSISRKEQYELLDLVCAWVREKEFAEVHLLIYNGLEGIAGMQNVLENIELQAGLKATRYSLVEETRQIFLGMKRHSTSLYPLNSRQVFFSCKHQESCLLVANNYLLGDVFRIRFGPEQILHFLQAQKKVADEDSDSLRVFLKANLQPLIDGTLEAGAPKLLSFDEESARLLLRILDKNLSAQKLGPTEILDLTKQIIQSDFNYLRGQDIVEAEDIDYISAQIILLGAVVKYLQPEACLLSQDQRFSGFIINQLVEENKLQGDFLSHQKDCQRHAREILLSREPESFFRALQLGELADELFECTYEHIHFWTQRQKKLLWLSCFLFPHLSKFPYVMIIGLLMELQGISQEEIEVVASVIRLSSTIEPTEQSRIIDEIKTDKRDLCKRLSSLVQIVLALDTTSRAVVQELHMKASKDDKSKLQLQIVSRFNMSPELLQLEIYKKAFEYNFEQTLEVEVMSNSPH